MDREKILETVEILRRQSDASTDAGAFAGVAGAISLLSKIYGPESAQADHLRSVVKANPKDGVTIGHAASGSLESLRLEVENGVLEDVRGRVAGELLGDFLVLAREALGQDSAGSVNVAAVLAAAAFEDTVRRMASDLCNVTERIELSKVLTVLKENQVVEGPQVGIAQSYLKFRNDAMHADWERIDRAGIESCVGFVEQLLMKHFS